MRADSGMRGDLVKVKDDVTVVVSVCPLRFQPLKVSRTTFCTK